jgi:hypothetical protein
VRLPLPAGVGRWNDEVAVFVVAQSQRTRVPQEPVAWNGPDLARPRTETGSTDIRARAVHSAAWSGWSVKWKLPGVATSALARRNPSLTPAATLEVHGVD